MSNPKLKAEALFKSYKNDSESLEVLRGINLTVAHNEFLAIQGPSGAGKSTLLHIIGGLDNPTRGEVFFDGANIYGFNENERADFRNRKIGFVFQFYHLLPELNVLENIMLPAVLTSWQERTKVRDQARSIAESLGLSGRLEHRPNQLSGGEQQRAAIARALINKPQVLLCDEPTGNLDSDNGAKILELLKILNAEDGVTVVMVTHNKEIASCADRVIYLKDGLILN